MSDSGNSMSDSGIFKAAVKLSADLRPAYLDQVCGTDHSLRQDVESLLRAHDATGDFLETPAGQIGRSDEATDRYRTTDLPGVIIGKFKLLQKIGEGGFGVVFMAEQEEPVRRKVALKIIKPGMDSREVIARFEAERQALAMMDHPNIAKVIDAGSTDDGRPFFVMELVTGISVVEFCDQNKFSTRFRLNVFTTICQAVQHAHQKGIIHRDIKPSNVMVTLHDGEPAPKIIDFGIAKAISQPLTEKTLFTQYGQMIGTPQYMSPEQAEMSDVDIDTRSDIYSLGVLLYELMTGTTPLDPERIRAAGFGEMLRLIQEEEPIKPSQRLSSLGNKLSSISQQRATQERTLWQNIKGDLDLIVMKSLEKDRHRRYESASSFAADIQRFLADEPIDARPPSTVYRTRKFIRRNKIFVTATSLVLLALVVGFATTSLAWFVAEKERHRADKNADELERHLYRSLLAQTESAVRDGKLTIARELVSQCPEDLRNWEWKHLKLRAEKMSVTNPLPGIEQPFFIEGDQKIVAIQNDKHAGEGSLVAWDAKSGEFIRILIHHDELFTHGALSHDRNRFAGADAKNVLSVWDMDSRLKLWSKKVHDKRINTVVFSPDGQKIGIASLDNNIRILAADDGAILQTINSLEPRHIQFSPDGKYIASDAAIWMADTGNPHVELKDDDIMNCVAFSPDGTLIANAGLDGRIKLWNVQDGAMVRELAGHLSYVRCLAFSSDGETIASGGADTTVRLWDIKTGRQLQTLGTHNDMVSWLSFSRDGCKVASFSSNNGILIWETVHPDVLTLKGYETPLLTAPCFAPNGDLVATDADGVTKIWDMETGQELRTLFGDDGTNALAVHPSGTSFATGTMDGHVQLRDITTGRLIKKYTAHDGIVYSVVFSPDGEKLASAGTDRKIRVSDVHSGKPELNLPGVDYRYNQIAYSPDGKWLAAQHYPSTTDVVQIRLWDARTGKNVRALEHPTNVDAMAFDSVYSTDGSSVGIRLACGCRDGTIKLWDPETGELLHTFRGRTGGVFGLALSIDSQRLWCATMDANLTIWDTRTGDELLVLRAHNQPVRIALSPDGSTIATGSADKTIKLWETKRLPVESSVARKTVELARRVVDSRFERLTFARDVIESLSGDKDLDESVKTIAVEIAGARGDNAYALSRASLEVVQTGGHERAYYKLALRKAVLACRVAPESPNCLTTLGIAQFRVGDYENALATLKRAEQTYIPVRTVVNKYTLAEPNHRRNISFMAMSLWHLGRTSEAQTELKKLRTLMQDDQWANHKQLSLILDEAEQLLEQRTGT